MLYLNILIEIAVIFFSFSGLLLNSGILKDGFRKDMFFYYTNLSNLWVFVYFSARLLCRILRKAPSLFFSNMSYYVTAISITVTFIIYHFVLLPAIKKAPENFGAFGNYRRYANLAVHYFSPLFTLLSWLLFAGKELPLFKSLLLWICVPITYLILAMLRGSTGKNLSGSSSPYPYGFMDPISLGLKRVTINLVVIFFAFVLLGFAFLAAAYILK